jgi:prephenate dehydrogenase
MIDKSFEIKFNKVAIVGLGLLGGSLAIDLRLLSPDIEIIGIARRQETLVEAELLNIDGIKIFNKLSNNIVDCLGSDLIVLCTPVQTIIDQLAQLSSFIESETIITDVGSTKRAIMNSASAVIPEGVYFVGGHPMAGSDKAGLSHAHAGLYKGATWALCENEKSGESVEKLLGLIASLGASPIIIDADSHDDVVSLTSHLPHLVASALVNTVFSSNYEELALPFMAGGFRDTTRVAAGNSALWRDILMTNRDRVLTSLTKLISELSIWREALQSGDEPYLEALLSTASERRVMVNKVRKWKSNE